MRYFIHLAYDGTPFFGWQVQPNHTTVQEVLEHCLSLLLHEPHVAVNGCGRTDTGVSATCFYAHFDFSTSLSFDECEILRQQLNSFLPKTIVIYRIFAVIDTANARFDAISRTYKYFIATRKNPFTVNHRLYCFQPLNLDNMREASTLLLTNEDFQSFSKVHTQVNNFICHVTEASWAENEGELIFTITANRFLRNMVRAVVGTLLDVGRGKISVTDFQNIMNQKNRCQAGTSASACALFLTDVRYNWNQIILEPNEK